FAVNVNSLHLFAVESDIHRSRWYFDLLPRGRDSANTSDKSLQLTRVCCRYSQCHFHAVFRFLEVGRVEGPIRECAIDRLHLNQILSLVYGWKVFHRAEGKVGSQPRRCLLKFAPLEF